MSKRKVAAICVTLASAGVLFGGVLGYAGQVPDRIKKRVATLVDSATIARVANTSDASSGSENAWARYREILTTLGGDGASKLNLSLGLDVAYRRVSADERVVERVVSDLAPAERSLDLLKLTIYDRYVYPPSHLSVDECARMYVKSRGVVENVVISKAALLFSSKREGEAWDLLSLGMVFGHNLWCNFSSISDPSCIVLDYLPFAIASHAPDRSRLERLERLLERLQCVLPDLRQEATLTSIRFGRGVLEGAVPLLPGPRKATAWELRWFLGCEALAAMDAFACVEANASRTRVADSTTWAEAMAELAEADRTRKRSRNPYVSQAYDVGGVPGELSIFWRRTVVAKLRMCQLLIWALLDRDNLALSDPFGGNLGVRKAGGLVIWSVGRNGVDDQASGGWSGLLHDKDIVLRFPR
jgi:hypothetical protein